MTEDERIFEMASTDLDLSATRAKLTAADVTLMKMDKIISQQGMLLSSLDESLGGMLSAPVISITEFRKVTTDRNKVEKDLHFMRSKRAEAAKLRLALLAEIDRLEQVRRNHQHALDNPPQVVLEFKPRE